MVPCRERAHASDFNAALYEHQQYLRRRVNDQSRWPHISNVLCALLMHLAGDDQQCLRSGKFAMYPPWQREAEAMRLQYEADTSGEAADGGPRQQRDYSLKDGQTLRIALPDKVCACQEQTLPPGQPSLDVDLPHQGFPMSLTLHGRHYHGADDLAHCARWADPS